MMPQLYASLSRHCLATRSLACVVHTSNHCTFSFVHHVAGHITRARGSGALVALCQARNFSHKAQKAQINDYTPLRLDCRAFHASALGRAKIQYNLADIGEGITECEVIQWFVSPGTKVSQFDKICEVQSDKATAEITSRYDGIISKLYYEPGELAIVGKPLVELEVPEEPSMQAAASETQPPSLPSVGPASEEPPAPIEAARQPPSSELGARSHDLVYATPAVRRLAREVGIDLTHVKGSGKGGRILKEDVLAASNAATTQQVSPNSVTQSAQKSPPVPSGTDELRPLSPLQKAMFKSMTESLAIPHFSFKDEVVVDEVIKARTQINESLNRKPIDGLTKISIMPFLIKAASLALASYPILNTRVVMTADDNPQLLYRSSHHISIAMDTSRGLVTPVIKDVQAKSIIEIARDLARLQKAGQANTLTLGDMSDGTFSLSNIGVIGGTYLFPVIVSSQVCIGAVGKIQRLPRFEQVVADHAVGHSEERVVAKHIMVTSWSADHRVIDGATLARFVREFKQYIESPAIMLAHLH